MRTPGLGGVLEPKGWSTFVAFDDPWGGPSEGRCDTDIGPSNSSLPLDDIGINTSARGDTGTS